jgi:hypothetical protein
MQQHELVDFLRGRKQVAFDTLDQRAIASRSGFSPRRAIRCAIQSGNSFGFNGQNGTNVPARSTAATPRVSCCLLHCVQVISSTYPAADFRSTRRSPRRHPCRAGRQAGAGRSHAAKKTAT